MLDLKPTQLQDLLLSCWIVETGRSMVFGYRGRHEAEARSAARARILASRCSAAGVKIRQDYAKDHAEWLAEVSGSEQETGALGLVFLQRIGAYVDAHLAEVLSEEEHLRLQELLEPEEEEANAALMMGGLKPPPPPERPATQPVEAPGTVRARIGLIGDPHVNPDKPTHMLKQAVRDLEDNGVDFAVAVGDITEGGLLPQFQKARELFDGSSVPIALTLGNHDLWAAEGGRTIGEQWFKEVFNRKPYSVHEFNGVRVIVLNSADPARSPFRPFQLLTGEFRTDHPKHSVPGGKFDEETREWMRGLGPDSKTTFIVLHHPPYPYLGLPPLVFGLDRASTEELADLVGRTGAEAVFCGHTHRCALAELVGVPAVEIASSNDWPYGYSVIEVTEEGWSFNLRPISGEHPVARADHAGYLFRRYATGPDEARAFAVVGGEVRTSASA